MRDADDVLCSPHSLAFDLLDELLLGCLADGALLGGLVAFVDITANRTNKFCHNFFSFNCVVFFYCRGGVAVVGFLVDTLEILCAVFAYRADKVGGELAAVDIAAHLAHPHFLAVVRGGQGSGAGLDVALIVGVGELLSVIGERDGVGPLCDEHRVRAEVD